MFHMPVSRTLQIPHSLVHEMLAHAQATPRTEVCGLLGARQNRACTIYKIPNIADNPACAFFMEPRAQIDAMRKIRKTGQRLFAIYHSHPSSGAEPSQSDLKQAAYREVFYVIISLLNGEIRAYQFDGEAFHRAALINESSQAHLRSRPWTSERTP